MQTDENLNDESPDDMEENVNGAAPDDAENDDDAPVENHETLDEAMAVLFAHGTPAEKGDLSKRICSREQIVVAIAPPTFRAFLANREPLIAELVDGSDLLPVYPTRSGLSKSVGDAIGQNRSGCRCHRGPGGAVRRCRENVSLILQKIPAGYRETVAVDAGLRDLRALVDFGLSLPSVVA